MTITPLLMGSWSLVILPWKVNSSRMTQQAFPSCVCLTFPMIYSSGIPCFCFFSSSPNQGQILISDWRFNLLRDAHSICFCLLMNPTICIWCHTCRASLAPLQFLSSMATCSTFLLQAAMYEHPLPILFLGRRKYSETKTSIYTTFVIKTPLKIINIVTTTSRTWQLFSVQEIIPNIKFKWSFH